MGRTKDFKAMYALQKNTTTRISTPRTKRLRRHSRRPLTHVARKRSPGLSRREVTDYYGDQTVLEKIEDKLREIRG